uniref:tRNA-dihydrouridine(47) synthase [NAD(P)(+)] n=1 Tax=Astyanax mexicanus TaxID=7994 RepID=A0A3B1JGJ3_ASTMX
MDPGSEGTESPAAVQEKGEAALKTQFITTRDKFHEYLASEGQKGDGEEPAETCTEEENGSLEEPSAEPELKKRKAEDETEKEEGRKDRKKMKGQNKSRPHMKPHSYEDRRLCPSIIQERDEKCFYGDKCKFLHDVADYLSTKPADVSERCYLYDTFGRCMYGITCRFAGAHTGPENNLDKDLQRRLRKRQVDFSGAEAYLKSIGVGKGKGGGHGKKSGSENSAETRCGQQEETSPGDLKTEVPLVKTIGPLTDADIIKLRPCEKKQVQWFLRILLGRNCGNLPFRRVCKRFGADITCGEMAMCTNLLQGQASEWALLKRHHTEDLFGVQGTSGAFFFSLFLCVCVVCGGGCGLMTRTSKFEQIVRGMNSVSVLIIFMLLHLKRFFKTVSFIHNKLELFNGNGDILSYEDALKARETGVSGIMLARGALIKPWIFTEIKERRHWDISSGERLDILKDFTHYGLEHWGSDTQGLERTRTFLLEWLSFTCRYIPVGLLERVPQKINERPPFYLGRDYLETLMASQHVGDWVKISEMLLGPVPKNFSFLPKHKANAYK